MFAPGLRNFVILRRSRRPPGTLVPKPGPVGAMAMWTCLCLAVVLIQSACATPSPFLLSAARRAVQAAQTGVNAAQGIGNAAIQAGSSGVNVVLDAVEGLEAVESNAVRAALNTGRALGTEVLNQTRSVAGVLPGSVLRRGATLGVDVAQRGLDLGVNTATLIANSTQAMVNGTAALGRRVNARVASAGQGGVNLASRVASRILTAKDNVLAAVQNLLPSRNASRLG